MIHDELKYIKGLLREFFDIGASYPSQLTEDEYETLIKREAEILNELEELSGFNQDE